MRLFRHYFSLISFIACMTLSSVSLTACSDDDDDMSAAEQQVNIKSDINFIGDLFLKEFKTDDYREALLVANNFRNDQLDYQMENLSIRNFIAEELQLLLLGDVMAVPRVLASVSAVEGTFVEDKMSKTWNRISNTSDFLVLNFTDKDGSNCVLETTWDNTKMNELPMESEDSTFFIKVPRSLTISLKKNGNNLIEAFSKFEILEKGLEGTLDIVISNLKLDASYSFTNDLIQLDNILTKNERNLMTATLNVNCPGLFSSLATGNDFDVTTIGKIGTTINILEDQLIVNGESEGGNVVAALQTVLPYYAGYAERTQVEAQNLSDVLNKSFTVTAETPNSGGPFTVLALPVQKTNGWDWTSVIVLKDGSKVFLGQLFEDFTNSSLYSFLKSLATQLNNVLAIPVTDLRGDGSFYTAPDGTRIVSEIYTAPNGKKYDIVDPSGWKNSFYNFETALALETDYWKLPASEGVTEFCEHRGTDRITYEELLGVTVNADGNPLYDEYIQYNANFARIFPTYAKYWAGTTYEGDRKGAYFLRVEVSDYATLDNMEHNKILYKHVRLVKRHED